jgi:hypothetical protein
MGETDEVAVRRARIAVHCVFDRIWKAKLVKHRGAAYDWMRRTLGLARSRARISLLNAQQCEHLTRCVYRDFPSLGDRYTHIVYGSLDE